MGRMSRLEEKMVFGLVPTGDGDGVPWLLLGIPAAAWEHMKDGKSHTFDLTKLGLPVKILLYGAADHDAAAKIIQDVCKSGGIALLDQRRDDFSIKPKG
jgi:hypothetical protein